MKTIRYIISLALAVVLCVSCQTDMDIKRLFVEEPHHTCLLRFNSSIHGFDGDSTSTRAGHVWQSGDILYIRFHNGGSIATGTAEYDAEIGGWTVDYTGTIASGTAEVSFIEGTQDISKLDCTTMAYQALDGSYALDGGILDLNAHLTPVTSRLRFAGDSPDGFTVSGVSQLAGFFPANGTFSFADAGSTEFHTGNGYHLVLTDKDNREITVTTPEGSFTKTFQSAFLQVGKAGWITLPTAASHNGWTAALDETIGTENGHRWVDLGLPSGLKWATCNVGASKPEEYGDYFAWGETKPKNDYSWNTYLKDFGGTMTSDSDCGTDKDPLRSYVYPNNVSISGTQYDAARQNWGGTWRMPTLDEMEELLNCAANVEWTTLNGVNGYKMTNEENGISIFIPAAGYRDGTSLYDAGSDGYCWCSSSIVVNDIYYADGLDFNSRGLGWYCYFYRYRGHPVRPVLGSLPVITPELSTIEFESSASSRTINVSANCQWTARTSASWVNVTATQNQLSVSVDENTSTSERTAEIRLMQQGSSTALAIVKVVQEVAMAQDFKWQTFLTETYDEIAQVGDVWTAPSNQVGLSLVVEDNGNKYVQYNNGNNNSRALYNIKAYTEEDYEGIDEYRLEFDLALTSGSNQFSTFSVGSPDIQTMGSDWATPCGNITKYPNNGLGSGSLFSLIQESVNSDYWRVYCQGPVGTNPDLDDPQIHVTLAAGTFYHFALTVSPAGDSGANVEAEITDMDGNPVMFTYGEEEVEKVTLPYLTEASGAYWFKQFYVLSGRYNSVMKIDNIQVMKKVDARH